MLRVVTSNNTAIFRELKSHSFQQLEMELVVVTTGTEALEKIRDVKPDLAVLDVDLPDMTGTDVCKLIKGDEQLEKVRVILVVTGSLAREDVERLSDSGCDDILTIPTPVRPSRSLTSVPSSTVCSTAMSTASSAMFVTSPRSTGVRAPGGIKT